MTDRYKIAVELSSIKTYGHPNNNIGFITDDLAIADYILQREANVREEVLHSICINCDGSSPENPCNGCDVGDAIDKIITASNKSINIGDNNKGKEII